jgi:hypothetical protein
MSLEMLVLPALLSGWALKKEQKPHPKQEPAVKKLRLPTIMNEKNFFESSLANLHVDMRRLADLGHLQFEQSEDGTYHAVFDEGFQAEVEKALEDIEAEYLRLVREDSYRKVLDIASSQGYTLVEETAENGEVRLLLRKF